MKHSNVSKAIKRFNSHLKYFRKVTDLALGKSADVQSQRSLHERSAFEKLVRILEDIAKGVKAIHIGYWIAVGKTGFKYAVPF